MSKYYCEYCDTEYNFSANGILLPNELSEKWEQIARAKNIKDKCPICGYEYEKIPDYETPAQYEKRTREAYSDDGLVFWKEKEEDGTLDDSYWNYDEFSLLKDCTNTAIVIASPPVPPPNDFVPEGV